ncbi:MAG: hypothetical protein AAF682_29035 [Planctomycetota bacterium]
MTQRFKRRRKLIKPRLQLRLVGTFAALTATGFLLQAQLFGAELMDLAAELPEGREHIEAAAVPLVMRTLVLSFGLLLPLILAIGIVSTFRIAGPVYRMEQHLGSLARGERPGPCRIRTEDELHELCNRLNAAVAALSPEAAAPADDSDDQRAA